jgi:endoglucanase
MALGFAHGGICSTRVRALGYNVIRLPFSDQLLDPHSRPQYINYDLNPDLRGLSGLQIMDRIVEGAARRGLRIVLDHHRPDCTAQSPLWYTAGVSERRWIDDLVALARR